ncbi:scarecrow-like transcription factor 11 (SCL11) [Forsythia ovata]|uniref:Scarecrow-like transcription factor 11 (SCL11) n=1 Tax=Forsythia ovata TaxID=205694 RepID=A0ABD1X776_9LAMI
MAKRELSSTLKNLKFMQRTAQKEEKGKKEEEVTPAADFPFSSIPKKCVVIVEGDPHPVATRGRMSFLSFNPSIDKLNEELHQPEASTTNSGRQSETLSTRENGNVQDGLDISESDSLRCDENGDLKRKQHDVVSDTANPNKSQKNFRANQQSSPNGSHNSHKKTKHEKLDWSVLRPPKYKNKKK